MDELTPIAKYTLAGFVLFLVGLMGAVLIAIVFRRGVGTALLFTGILFAILFITFSMTRGLAEALIMIQNPPHKRKKD
jgi:Na+-transporting NADH:ubiquinone oxidoreductase subunit NqrB